MTDGASGNAKVADNYIVTAQGFHVVTKVEEDVITCYPVRVAPLKTDYLGYDLPWRLVGVCR